MFVEKFRELYNSNSFDLLVCGNKIADIEAIENSTNPASLMGIEYNITRRSHRIFVGYFCDNGHFDNSEISSELLKERTLIQTNVYQELSRTLDEKCYGFNTLILENSYDIPKIRTEIKSTLDSWNPYYKAFLSSSLNVFDGESANYLNELSFSKQSKLNYVICHEYPVLQWERDKKIIEDLCNLYQITTTKKDVYDLYQLLEKLVPLLQKENLKLSFKLSQSKLEVPEIELLITPIAHENKAEVISFTVNHLVDIQMVNINIASQLKEWDNAERKLGHLSIKIKKQDMIRTEVLATYGFI